MQCVPVAIFFTMKTHLKLLIISLLISKSIFSQTHTIDTLNKTIALSEVVVISKSLAYTSKQSKVLASVDEYLSKSASVSLIKRGAYAWEPAINNMQSERLNITIDGMHIFGACTDKMDPVTSYVDISNLEEIKIYSGQVGTATGPTIGGALDLIRKKQIFCEPHWSGALDLGAESNGNQITSGAKLNYAAHRFYSGINLMYRHSDNYKAGKGKTVPFSQFSKYNIAANIGWKINEKNSISGSMIFDNATNVGYPALPMDVSLAQAIIGNIEHTTTNPTPIIKEWTTKVYFNTIKHTMDDTKRPDVPIHMDMPGWSDTYGLHSTMRLEKNRHIIQLNTNAYHNRSLAEMTMYPADKSEPPMFMYTWPDIRTSYTGVSASDKIQFSKNKWLRLNINAGLNHNHVANEFGLNSLKIFYPKMKQSKTRVPFGMQSSFLISKGKFEILAGAGYGERAPSVSEGYGFYLFNSFDKYDYIGNPNLKTEKSLESSLDITYRIPKIKINFLIRQFRILDYIIGIYHPEFSPMTIGANGVRIYESLKYANLLNTRLTIDLYHSKFLYTKAFINYSRGRDFNGYNLPLIKPLSYQISEFITVKQFNMEIMAEGATRQTNYSKEYSEIEKPSYVIFNLNLGYNLILNKKKINLRMGIENITDKYYSTYADWNNIPRKGRNFFISTTYTFH